MSGSGSPSATAALTCASPISGRSATCCSAPAARSCPPSSPTSPRTRWRPAFDRAAFAARLRARRSGIKRALLDQSLISGVGNIYADEALWRARLHWARAADRLRGPDVSRLVDAVQEVFAEALHVGGTSFDHLYVNVNGQSGYFDRSLAVYGRAGEPCPRCGAPGPPGRLHEPVVLLLPGLPAPAAQRPGVTVAAMSPGPARRASARDPCDAWY